MGNSILAGTVSLNPFLPPLALAQEKPSSPAAQPSPAPAQAFLVVGSWLAAESPQPRAGFLCMGLGGKPSVNMRFAGSPLSLFE